MRKVAISTLLKWGSRIVQLIELKFQIEDAIKKWKSRKKKDGRNTVANKNINSKIEQLQKRSRDLNKRIKKLKDQESCKKKKSSKSGCGGNSKSKFIQKKEK